MKRLQQLWRRLFMWFELAAIAGIAIFLFVVGGSVLWAVATPLPSIQNFESRRVAESTKIYDRTGNVILYDVHGSMRRTAIPLEDISLNIRNATIAIEDAEFYQHNGFRPLAFLRAVLVNLHLRDGIAGQGGSTITQQVVKNTLLTKDKTLIRKAKEIVLALRLEKVYTKEQILEAYLNEAPYGGTIYGVEEASRYFFGVSAADVTLAQAAYLAALPQAPTRYSPYGNNKDELEQRKSLVLRRMNELEFVDDETRQTALEETVEFQNASDTGIKAPHFVFYIREYLEEKYGPDMVASGGLRVITTLDYDLQRNAEDIIAGYAPSMEENFNATNEGLVATDPKTGQILAMVGSRGYFDESIDGKVNIAVAQRQPGSSFKPFVYATAFKEGYTPETVVFDLKTQFSSLCESNDFSSEPPCYSPENFDNTFKGPLTLRNALAQSVNIPAVKVLYLTGITDAIKTARDLGISTLTDAGRYGLTLVLGGGEVTLLDLTNAYGAFANEGVANPHTGILRVEDTSGKILESYENKGKRVLDAQVSRQISDILSDNAARTPEFGAASPLYFPGTQVADKTGTTNDFRDVWIVGYTPSISIGAWAGNNDNSPMVKKIAAFVIAPMWHDVMEYAIQKYPSDSFIPPAPDPDFDNLSPVLRGEWNADPTQGVHEILYWIEKNNPRGEKPKNPWSDSQYAHWEYPVSLWAGQQSSTLPGNLIPGGGGGDFTVILPNTNTTFSGALNIPVAVSYPDGLVVTRVLYFLNNESVGVSTQPPFFHLFTTDARGPVELKAIFETSSGPVERYVPFFIQ